MLHKPLVLLIVLHHTYWRNLYTEANGRRRWRPCLSWTDDLDTHNQAHAAEAIPHAW